MIVVFDLETTGTYPTKDRIVQIGAVKMDENFVEKDRFVQLINPDRPIPPGATEVHRITDEDVKDAPKLEEVADDVIEFFGDCDLGGFNVLSFDIPLLIENLRRCGKTFSVEGRRIFDAYSIYRQYERRDLASAYRTYCKEEIGEDAHDAMVDTLATASVIESQVTYYKDHTNKIETLDDLAKASMGNRVTFCGKLVWNENGEVCLSFGKNKGKTLEHHYHHDKQYLRWVLRGEFTDDMKHIVTEALEGKFPKREENAGGKGAEGDAAD